MRWAVLLIAIVTLGVVAALWQSGGAGSLPMVLAALAIALVCSLVPFVTSRKRPKNADRETRIVRDP